MGALMGPGRCWAHQGLRPCMAGSPLLEAGSHAGLHAPLGSSLWDTVTQCSVAHGFLIHCTETESSAPQILKELLWEDGDSETHECTFHGGRGSVCMAGLRTDKEMGNSWAWLWLVVFWGVREVLGLVGEEGSEQKCSQPCPPNSEPC